MYPKQTFFNKNSANRKISRSDDLSYTHLILHDKESSVYQSFDIDMPYLILYKSVNIAADTSIYQEFSENNKVLTKMSYKDIMTSPTSNKLHFHNFYELTFVLSGELTMKIEDKYIVYRQGDCCLCNKNIHHLELMEQDTEIVLFLMKEEYLHDVFRTNYYYDRMGNPHPIKTVFDSFFSENKKNPMYDAKVYADYRCLNLELSEPILTIVNMMITEISEIHSGKCHMIKALLCRFFEMIENSSLYQGEIHRARLSNEEQIIYQITEAYRKKDGIFSRAEIEKITGYNSDYVERIIKRHTGKTLLTYGREFLLLKAAELLKNTNFSVEEICRRLGYSNRYYFNRIFEKQFGMMPSEFRKMSREK